MHFPPKNRSLWDLTINLKSWQLWIYCCSLLALHTTVCPSLSLLVKHAMELHNRWDYSCTPPSPPHIHPLIHKAVKSHKVSQPLLFCFQIFLKKPSCQTSDRSGYHLGASQQLSFSLVLAITISAIRMKSLKGLPQSTPVLYSNS